jgi:acyl-CoA synthetase (NDP forming)
VPSPHRSVYRRDKLLRLFHPQSIAIIGASTNESSFGAKTLDNLSNYTGRIHLVNAKYDRVGERNCYPSVAALPESPDCALIAVGRELVAPIVEECIAAKVGGIMLYASGYSETGKPGRAAQQAALSERARASGIPIVGPNAMGGFNYLNGAVVTFVGSMKHTAPVTPQAIGIVSQSGALSISLAQAIETGVSVSHILLSGNSCDVDVADCIAFLAEDPACTAIACVFEGMPDPLRLLEAGDIAWKANKPVVVCKIATGERGAAAAVSHTGSLAGSNAAYRALFERAGMMVVDHFEALVEAASFFTKLPPLTARGVACITASGGAGIMLADKAEIHGVPMPQPNAQAHEVLVATIPEFGSPRNPCDVTAQIVASPEMTRICAEALLKDDSYGTLVFNVGSASDRTPGTVAAMGELAEQYGKLVCASWIGQWADGPGSREAARHPRLALFRSPDRCFAAIAAWHRREQRRALGPRQPERLSPPAAAQQAAELITRSPNTTLTEREAKAVLALYGVPVVGERLVKESSAAVSAAAALGFPVALKVESPDIPHKTEAGVIRLNLKSEADVRSAYDAVMKNAKAHAPDARINGVLVQPMAPAGLEMMAGGRIDAQFGPLIVAGLGGVMVELMKDTAMDLAPITLVEARAMLDKLRGRSALDGFRGMPAVDIDKLAGVIVRLSEFADDQQGLIGEFDVNPLICAGERIMAVDALIVKKEQAVSA